MNSCVLMVEVIKDPELRYTVDDQVPISEMLVQFSGLRAEDPAEMLKVVGWGNLAQQIQEQYHHGDRVVIEGRLSMNTIERPEGFKEKRAELTASRIHPVGMVNGFEKPTSSTPDITEKRESPPKTAEGPSANYDDIPF